MSLCDRCIAPGTCCMAMHFNGDNFTIWDDEPMQPQLDDLMYEPEKGRVHPFFPKELVGRWTDEESGRSYSAHVWGCKALDPKTGRCTVYEKRPQLCRDFEPASDGLCVYFNPLENGEESIL